MYKYYYCTLLLVLSFFLFQTVKIHVLNDFVMPRVLEESTTTILRTLNGVPQSSKDSHSSAVSSYSSRSSFGSYAYNSIIFSGSSYSSSLSSSFLHLTVTHGRMSLRYASISPEHYILSSNGIILFIDAVLLP